MKLDLFHKSGILKGLPTKIHINMIESIETNIHRNVIELVEISNRR